MNTTFTTASRTTFTANEAMTHCYCWPEGRKGERIRIKKREFEQAKREHELEMQIQETAEEMAIEEDMNKMNEERRVIPELEPAVFNKYGCVECHGCPIANTCIHKDCMRRNPVSVGGLGECFRLKEKYVKKPAEPIGLGDNEHEGLHIHLTDKESAELDKLVEKFDPKKKAKKAHKSKDIAWAGDGIVAPHTVTLTTKQVDFILHLSDTCFWEHGLESQIWIDVLCDEIGGQFAGKPMTVGAMISTLCEKGLGQRAKERMNGKKCTSFALTEIGKKVAAEVGLQ